MNVENKLKQVNKNILGSSMAFLSLGAACFLMPQSITTIFVETLSSMSILMLLLEYDIKKNWDNFKRAGPERSLLSFFYNQVFKNKIKEISLEPDLYQQKYELLFLSLLMTHHRAELTSVLDIKTIALLDVLSDNLFNKGVTKFHFESVLHNAHNDTENCSKIIMEDMNNPSRLEQIKSVFKQYENVGLLGKSLVYPNANTQALMQLQENFTASDYQYFTMYIKEDEKYADSRLKSNSDRFESCHTLIMEKIAHEQDEKNLLVLKRFFKYSPLSQYCDVKKSYEALSEKLNTNVITEAKPQRRHKI